jgi:hypothetical protein
MTRATIWYGGALVIVGVVAYITAAMASVTALIPAFLGAIVLVLGLVARGSAGAAPWLVVAAVVVAVLAILGSFRGIPAFAALLGGQDVERPVAAVAQAAAVVLSIAYLAAVGRLWAAAR